MRYYSKEQQRSELCPPPPPKKTRTGTALTFGALALAGGAIIGYAKYDPDFRCHLVEYVPFTDDVIKFVFQEEKTYYESLQDLYAGWRQALFPEQEEQRKKKKRKVITETDKDYKRKSFLTVFINSSVLIDLNCILTLLNSSPSCPTGCC